MFLGAPGCTFPRDAAPFGRDDARHLGGKFGIDIAPRFAGPSGCPPYLPSSHFFLPPFGLRFIRWFPSRLDRKAASAARPPRLSTAKGVRPPAGQRLLPEPRFAGEYPSTYGLGGSVSENTTHPAPQINFSWRLHRHRTAFEQIDKFRQTWHPWQRDGQNWSLCAWPSRCLPRIAYGSGSVQTELPLMIVTINCPMSVVVSHHGNPAMRQLAENSAF